MHCRLPFGYTTGDNRTRTCDPLHVKQMLSQLSYVSLDLIYFVTNFRREMDDLLALQHSSYYNRNSSKIAR